MTFVHRGNVFWTNFYYTTGSEQAGLRPCIIVSNDLANKHSPTVTIVPITSRNKKALPTHATVFATGQKGTALCEHICSISKDRLGQYIADCSAAEMEEITKCLKVQLGI